MVPGKIPVELLVYRKITTVFYLGIPHKTLVCECMRQLKIHKSNHDKSGSVREFQQGDSVLAIVPNDLKTVEVWEAERNLNHPIKKILDQNPVTPQVHQDSSDYPVTIEKFTSKTTFN